MRPYTAVLSARFRTLLQYRAAAFGGICTQLFFGLVMVMVYEAFYHGVPEGQPMTLSQVITYVWLGQALLAMLPWNPDRDLARLMRTGGVVYDLLRPLDLYAYWFTRVLALRTAPTLLRAAPIVVAAMLLFGMEPPVSSAAGAAWALSTLGALLLGCALTTLLNVTLIWTIAGEGAVQLVLTLVLVFSGMLVPLPLMPSWAQRILAVLPFGGLVDAPFRLYVGHRPPSAVWPLLAHQLAWTAALVLAGRALLARGTRRLVVQGG